MAVESPELCLNSEQQKRLSLGIQDFAKCRFELIEKERLIQERLIAFNSGGEPLAWWQEPQIIVGGMVVSVGVGGILTYYLLRR